VAPGEEGGEKFVVVSLLKLPMFSCGCLRHLSSLVETKTSASKGSTMFLKIDASTLLLPLVSSHKLLVSPTKHTAIFGRDDCSDGDGDAWFAEREKTTLNLEVNATMPVDGAALVSAPETSGSRMMSVAATAYGSRDETGQKDALKMKVIDGSACHRCRDGGTVRADGKLQARVRNRSTYELRSHTCNVPNRHVQARGTSAQSLRAGGRRKPCFRNCVWR
jgi:hypothetical protein